MFAYGSKQPLPEYGEVGGECDRCGNWSRSLGDGFCFGCHEAERKSEPVRVPADSHPTHGARWPTSPTPISDMMREKRARDFRRDIEIGMRLLREREAENERPWQPLP